MTTDQVFINTYNQNIRHLAQGGKPITHRPYKPMGTDTSVLAILACALWFCN